MKDAFCTLFDSSFAPQGIALLNSIEKFMPGAPRFVLAMDSRVEEILNKFFKGTVHIIQLSQIENDSLLRVKADRTVGEYCWTLTPFLPDFILSQFPSLSSVTYLDADVFFFSSPMIMLDELRVHRKQVLITEHGYDPKYDQTLKSGKFCVQFTTFTNSEKAREILHWWKTRCLEWCYARVEDGKFGDQKYLDVWPEIFQDAVHIYSNCQHTLAPWNVEWFLKKDGASAINTPVLYHFHGLRLFSDRTRLFDGYSISKQAQELFYQPYLKAVISIVNHFRGSNLLAIKPWKSSISERIRLFVKKVQRRVKFVPIP